MKLTNVPTNANILGSRLVFTLRNHGTLNEQAKVRNVAHGFKNSDKSCMVHETITMRAFKMRKMISAEVVNLFRISSRDVTKAYSQSNEKMTRKFYICPKREDFDIFGLKEY